MGRNFELTTENYYTPEADKAFLSCSQFETFLQCEAAAMAKIEGRYEPKKSEAFVVGNYFHTAFESRDAHEEFILDHQEDIFQKNGKKRAAFVKADDMIAHAIADPAIRRIVEMDGENEKIMTGKLFGTYPWRIRLDKYIAEPVRMIIDWKTVANIHELLWDEEARAKASFVRTFRYLFRAAVYMEIEKQNAGSDQDPLFRLVCISKQDPPDKEMVDLNNRQELDLELEKVKEKIWNIQAIKDGRMKPRRCGRCAYCRSTKKITGALDYWQLDPGNFPDLEEEYDELWHSPKK